ncbi:GNAT family N-acetyltransferase [Pseudooceanicola algae]|uniref:GNAT family N-acetyltransferase n=1 Tax=Pseudooceanicola algae TaxID=1537215 RepID=UPI001E61316C|nr:GNAT family N-acetyltransferase [Pseudooceanicola algae]
MTIRRAQADDVVACAAVVDQWIEATDWMPRDASRDELETGIAAALPKREIWVAGDPVEAYLSLDPETLKIGGFYCAYPGRGVGRALMDRVKQGRDFLWLHTHAPNEAAQRFYHREGFVVTGSYLPTPPATLTEIRMEWRP